MNRRAADDGEAIAGSVDLAREAPFTLAHVRVTPAALTVEAAGWSRRLEPRAMQVLVVLARASPAVVGRAELNGRVWGGRIVGEDAINRTVQTLRRLATEAPSPAPYRIHTIPRIGYRLTAGSEADEEHASPATNGDAGGAIPAPDRPVPAPSRRRSGLSRPGRTAVAAACLAMLLLGVVLWQAARMRHAASGWTITDAAAVDDLPADASDAVLSPDGRRLAYRGRDPQGRERVFLRATSGGGAGVPVSPPELEAHLPSWSPDGHRIAFSAYDPGRPCRLYVVQPGRPASPVGSCETARDPRLSWSVDGGALLFGDAPGWNAVPRVSMVRIGDGERTVLSSPPGDSMGDDFPIARARDIVFQRQYAWSDEAWVSRDTATGRERVLWRRDGVAESDAAALPDGSLVVAWTRAGASGLDFIGTDGRVRSQPVTLGPITSVSAGGGRLMVQTDRRESALVRADGSPSPRVSLLAVRGWISGPALLGGDRVRFPVAAAGVARIWERGGDGSLRPWGRFTAVRISGLAPSPDGRLTAALVTGKVGREVVVFDATGRPAYRWNPHARSVNAAAWSGDGRRLIVPVLDGAGWRLFALDPFGRTPPRDLGLPGFAVLLGQGPALYAVRAGEMMGERELWRIDGRARRLPIDLTLFDIVNWRPVDRGIWLPDRRDREHPRLVLRDVRTGDVLRSVAAPDLAPSGSGLAADARGPVYVATSRDAPEYGLLGLSRTAP